MISYKEIEVEMKKLLELSIEAAFFVRSLFFLLVGMFTPKHLLAVNGHS